MFKMCKKGILKIQVEYKYIEAKAHIGQQVFEFKVADFVQWGQKNWAYLA